MELKLKAAVIGALDIEHMGGGEGNAVMISNLLMENGFNVKYFGSGCPVDNSKGHEEVDEVFEYEPSAFSHDFMANPFILRTTRLLSLGLVGFINFRKALKKVRGYDLYYFQNPTYLVRKLVPILLKQGSRVIVANHGTYFEYLGNSSSPLLRMMGKIATKFILDPLKPYRNSLVIHTQNSYQTSFYLQNGFPGDRIMEIPQHNVDMRMYSIDPAKGSFHVAFLGRLTESKGLDILPEIIHKNPDIIFHIMGNGPMKDRLKGMIEGKNAILHGFVSDVDKREILSQCDAIIIPSYFESLSIAAIEGLASGLPIIGSETAPGLRHILRRNALFGNLVPRTAESFSQWLSTLKKMKEKNTLTMLNDRFLRREKAIELFDPNVLTQKLAEMFEMTLQIPPKTRTPEMESPVTG